MISIALAAYNGEKYIAEQLDSILKQTIHDFEVVVCDDRSTDTTWAILQEYQARDNRIKLYRNEINLGFKKNFEKAIKLCQGEYVALCDQDDIWLIDHLEKLRKNIKNKVIACGNSLIVNEKGESQGITLRENMRFEVYTCSDQDKSYRLLYFSSPYQGSAMLIKKEFFEVALPIPDSSNSHDAWFATLACFAGGINYMEEVILKYRSHSSNSSKISKKRTYLYSFQNAVQEPNLFNDRIGFCKEILKRVTTLSQTQIGVLNDALNYHQKKSSRFFRFKNISFRIKNYKKIYSTNSYKLLFIRIIKYLI